MTPAPGAPGRLDHLDALRAVLVFFVVCIHALGYGTLPPGKARDLAELVVSPIAVQGFYLVDGLLFARRCTGPGFAPGRFLGDSARRLLGPWLLFGLFYIAARYAGERYGILEPTRLTAGGLSLRVVGESLWWSEVASQLYFLPSLFIIRVLAILARRLFAAPSPLLIASAIVLLLVFRTVVEPAWVAAFPHPGFDPVLHALGGLSFFVIGAGLWGLRGATQRNAPALAAAIIAIGLGLAMPGVVGDLVFQLGYLASAYLLFAAGFVRSSLLVAIGRRTMGIYLLHMPIVMKVAATLAGTPALATFGLVVMLSFGAALGLTLALQASGLSGLALGERKAPPRSAAVGAW